MLCAEGTVIRASRVRILPLHGETPPARLSRSAVKSDFEKALELDRSADLYDVDLGIVREVADELKVVVRG